MLAIVVNDSKTVDDIHGIFARLKGYVVISSTGAPVANGISIARGKIAVVIFDIIQAIDTEIQNEMIDKLNPFNITERQSFKSVNRKNGFFTNPNDSYEFTLGKTIECLRFHIRLWNERQQLLACETIKSPLLKPEFKNRPTADLSAASTEVLVFKLPSVLSVFKTVYQIMERQYIDCNDTLHSGYLVPKYIATDNLGYTILAVGSRQNISEYINSVKDVLSLNNHSTIVQMVHSSNDIQIENKTEINHNTNPFEIWVDLLLQYNETYDLHSEINTSIVYNEALQKLYNMCPLTAIF